MSVFAQFLEAASVPWQGFDLDADHRSLSRNFPGKVELAPLGEEPVGDLLKLFRKIEDLPVSLVDPRAHLGEHFMEALRVVQFPERFSEVGGRITVALFPADDLEVLTDIDHIVAELQDQVDYLIIKNRARAQRTRMFDGSPLESDLHRFGALELEIPVLLSWAKNHLAALEVELERGVPHLEAVTNKSLALDSMARLVIEDWLKCLFHRFSSVEQFLIPEELRPASSQVDTAASVNAPVRRGAKINRQNL